MSFLSNIELRPISLSGLEGSGSVGLALGKGPNALEVAVATASFAPSATLLRTVWKNRVAGRATPLLLVVLYDGRVAICGPAGDPPPTYSGLDPDKVERLCAAALEEPNRNAALRLLYSAIPQVDAPLFGLRNEQQRTEWHRIVIFGKLAETCAQYLSKGAHHLRLPGAGLRAARRIWVKECRW